MYLTIVEAAGAMGKSPRAVRYAVEAKKLPAIRKGKAWLLRLEDLPLTDSQRKRFSDDRAKVREVVERVLGEPSPASNPGPSTSAQPPISSPPPAGTPPHRAGRAHGALQLDVCQTALQLVQQLPAESGLQPARAALEEGIRGLCAFTYEYEVRRKLDALNHARRHFSVAVAELLLQLPAPPSPIAPGSGPLAGSNPTHVCIRAVLTGLEERLFPPLGALMKKVEKPR